MIDVFRAAKSRGWWKPKPNEYVTTSEFRTLLAARKEAQS